MRVLSLFDGMSCGQIALNRIGVKPETYYASEVDKYAIKVTQANYPDTVQLGDINNWQEWDIDWGSIDLLTAGFPCQAWSVAGKQKGDDDPRGALVHVLIAIWGHCRENNPNLKFLFENVKMKKEFLDYISDLFGVEPILINSALVSAQNRRRYYWTNIDGVEQPEDNGILLKDIVHEGEAVPVSDQGKCVKAPKDKSHCLMARDYKGFGNQEMTGVSFNITEYIVPFDKTLQILEKEVEKGKVGYFRKDSQANRVYYIHGKSVTLCGEAGGGAAKMGQYLFGCITPDRVNKRQNGQRFNEGKKFYTLTAQDKHGVLIEGYIRKLTPIECERLQTVHDNYTNHVSNTQRYKMIGNGWTVDVIAHIFKNL